jgi:hypothetical protein
MWRSDSTRPPRYPARAPRTPDCRRWSSPSRNRAARPQPSSSCPLGEEVARSIRHETGYTVVLPHALAEAAAPTRKGMVLGRAQAAPAAGSSSTNRSSNLHGDILVPDLAGWRHERMPEVPDAAAFELAPDWICEVLSPSTAATDRAEKMQIYDLRARARRKRVACRSDRPDARSVPPRWRPMNRARDVARRRDGPRRAICRTPPRRPDRGDRHPSTFEEGSRETRGSAAPRTATRAFARRTP